MRIQYLIIFIIFSFIYSSCTTKKGETTKLGKFYHNVTGHYNAYYNADLLLMKGFEAQAQTHRDNYNEILHLFPYAAGEKPSPNSSAASGTNTNSTNKGGGPLKNNSVNAAAGASNTSSSGSSLDDAIKKSAINIELHRPSNFADDSYFIVGRAEFLKKEFEKSAATFKYIVDKYHKNKALSEMSPDELKEYRKNEQKKKKSKKKKKKGKKTKSKSTDSTKKSSTDEEDGPKPESYFLKHKPVRYEAMLWLAKSFIELENYDDAGRYLRLLIEKTDVSKKVKAQAHAVSAYAYIKQKEYLKAIPELEQSISLIRRKKNKVRFVYVLAQLYQEIGSNQLAMEYFRKVPRANPPYEMEFNARLNMAINASSSERSKIDPETSLKRMLRDGKNEEYKDQIYFALAKIQLNSGNKENGILALQMAMQNADDFQKTEATYLLAEIFNERKDYVKAYAYFDTCSTVMQQSDERYSYVSEQKFKLKELAENINIVTLKDSLLSIASWSFDRQKELVQKLRMDEEASKKPQNALNRNSGAQALSAAGINPSAVNASKFPLYDPNATKKGERDFQRRWGNREWADNWRRTSNESRSSEDNVAKNEVLKPLTESEVKEYLKKMGVPEDSVKMNQMNKEIETALFLVASNYYEKLDENKRAASSISELFKRYPKTKYELEAWFLMYNICVEDKNSSCSSDFKDKILKKYADTDIAKSLKDPNFLNAKQRQIAEVNRYYEDTYALIRSGEHEEAFNKIEELPKKYGINYPMKPRFAILAAMCIGGMQGKEEYIKALRSVSVSYPSTEEDNKAKEMVALLSGDKSESNNSKPSNVNNNPNEPKGNYPFDNIENTGHYVLVTFDEERVNMNEYKSKITEFNNSTFSLMRLSVSSLMLDGKMPTLIVRKFKDRQQAVEYRNTVEGNSTYLGKDAPAYKVYFIGQNNYRQILQKQNFTLYKEFFSETYE